ncbi:MAG: SH3 domain-containing protein [Lyngbya sp.]|nr:SH3 domain-containing protein [Lyngbya sp.]
MKLKQILLTITAAASVCVATALPGFATSARLTANDPGAQINVRTAPTTQANSPHYGVAGDWVEVLNSSDGGDGYIWYYVRFYQSGAEGWVRSDFLSF